MSDELHTPVQVDIDRDKIKRAVKEALDDKRMDDLAQQLTNLSTQMATGFSAVHTRQDQANGKLMKHETDLLLQKGINAQLENEIKDLRQTEQSKETFWKENRGKATWGLIGIVLMLFYYLLQHAGFPNFLN